MLWLKNKQNKKTTTKTCYWNSTFIVEIITLYVRYQKIGSYCRVLQNVGDKTQTLNYIVKVVEQVKLN